jgi:hypothetical protein
MVPKNPTVSQKTFRVFEQNIKINEKTETPRIIPNVSRNFAGIFVPPEAVQANPQCATNFFFGCLCFYG